MLASGAIVDERIACARKLSTYPYVPLFATTWPRKTIIHSDSPAKNMFGLTEAEWLAPDEELIPQLLLRRDLYHSNPSEVFAVAPGYESLVWKASQELLEKLAKHLAKQFPNIYRLREDRIEILPLGESFSYRNRTLHPLVVCGYLVQDDFNLLLKNESGEFILAAVFLAQPSFWSPSEHLGQNLLELHEPVPDYESKMKAMVESFMERLVPHKIQGRNNWKFYENPNLAVPLYAQEAYDAKPITPESVGETVFLRSEFQSLIKLPKSQAIVFTVRPRVFYLPDLKRKEPQVVAKLVSALEKNLERLYVDQKWIPYLINYLRVGAH